MNVTKLSALIITYSNLKKLSQKNGIGDEQPTGSTKSRAAY